MEGLRNIVENDVKKQIDELLPTMPNICSCNDCKLDMAAYALNRLKPNYVRTDIGAAFHKANTFSAQAQAEILTAVMTAINTIGANPHRK